MSDTRVCVTDVRSIEHFTYRWPDAVESFEGGWEYRAEIDGQQFGLRHGIGSRVVYGRERVHTVTWLKGQPTVEGVEADDYPVSQALLSGLRRPDRKHVRRLEEVPPGYESFEVVEHHREVEAPYSPHTLAVKIREDDLGGWALHAWLRRRGAVVPPASPPLPAAALAISLPAPPTPDEHAVARALLRHGETLAGGLVTGGTLAPEPEADHFVRTDAFAFLVAVIADMGIRAERAWMLPLELRTRLGHWELERIAAEPEAVRQAFHTPPKLHRFINMVPPWISAAAAIVLSDYGGDTARIWSGRPAAAEVRARLRSFPGIEQKKSAMAVELLERYLGIEIDALAGSDVAYDVHVRRVFLRGGLALRDDVNEMVGAARRLHPERPGALDNPAWDIGRRWCHPGVPDCPSCPLKVACPRLVDRARGVRGA